MPWKSPGVACSVQNNMQSAPACSPTWATPLRCVTR
ncbi:hypothetical protein XccvBFoX4_gp68c [Xanthomonas phage FoX4]|uniref:Uncharacterized protein n=1 Tax=Xanthomonas phage FoX4 TaxID=2723900 RepID=A0A858WJ44_9CAUD|nr:hypothetical protein KNU97_gp68 [Xanthomonas phage FoX4]QJI53022.1 hypothetical protein XccvBFoX4_gp68c [Xanthomonas phage FoX4]